MPGQTTIYRWLLNDEEFRKQYVQARALQAESLFDESLEIADDARNDWMERRGEEDAGWVANGEHIQRSRLRIDTRKWMAARLDPKKYGDKQAVELTGKDGGAIETKELSPDKAMEKAARSIALLFAKAVKA